MLNCKICIYSNGFSIIGCQDVLKHVYNLYTHYGWTRYMRPPKYIPNRIFVATDNIKLLYCTIKYLKENKMTVLIV